MGFSKGINTSDIRSEKYTVRTFNEDTNKLDFCIDNNIEILSIEGSTEIIDTNINCSFINGLKVLDNNKTNQITTLLSESGLELHGINNLNDTIIGKKVIIKNSKMLFNGTGSWTLEDTGHPNTTRFSITLNDAIENTIGITSLGRFINGGISITDEEVIQIVGGKLYLRILKSRLNTQDEQGLLDFLASNNITIVYNLKESYYTQYILENYSNIFKCYYDGYLEVLYNGICPKIKTKYLVNRGNEIDSNFEDIQYLKSENKLLWESILVLTQEINNLKGA